MQIILTVILILLDEVGVSGISSDPRTLTPTQLAKPIQIAYRTPTLPAHAPQATPNPALFGTCFGSALALQLLGLGKYVGAKLVALSFVSSFESTKKPLRLNCRGHPL
ncbi:hypothetical protein DFH11DRAFT_1731296 [Phellopilus nigrolimitatus]|nr:hypothetical protein DFH11DRAFT_1731296 [Phellopilus nigrolimitatus]